MFDALSDRLERISTRLRGKGRISEADLDEALGEIRTALQANPMRARLNSGRYFVRFVTIQEDAQRRSICA